MFVIKDIPNSDIPVFTVQSTTSRKTRTLHRNMLLPFNHVPPCASDLPIVSRTPVSRRKSLRNKSDLQESDSSDPEIIQTKTIRTNQNYSDDSYSSSNTNEHYFALFQNEFQSSENIGDSTEKADGRCNSYSEKTILIDSLPNKSVSPVMPRRSARSRKPPDRFGEWVS